MLKIITLAREISESVRRFGLSGPALLAPPKTRLTLHERYLACVTDEELRQHTESRFRAGHNQDAVFEAYKHLNNVIKRRVRATGQDGTKLMEYVFSPNDPVLCLNDHSTQSQKDEQAGYMKIYAGVMKGIRNPRAHENQFDNDPDTTLELLSLANHLLERAKSAKKRRRKLKKAP